MSGRDHSETVCPECHCTDEHDPCCSETSRAIRQLRADLARVTAERDAYRAERDEALSNGLGWQERWAHDTARLEMERDALSALLPTEAEREALTLARGILIGNKCDRFVRESTRTIDTALAYLDRLLGGGR